MPKFMVEIERRKPLNSRSNPFRAGAVWEKSEVEIRKWEMEAENEEQVRSFFKEAKDDDHPNVRGFDLKKIIAVLNGGGK